MHLPGSLLFMRWSFGSRRAEGCLWLPSETDNWSTSATKASGMRIGVALTIIAAGRTLATAVEYPCLPATPTPPPPMWVRHVFFAITYSSRFFNI
ncbi:hypothetical protein BJX76DRAFT_37173 [Aspergillus varians]